MKNTQENSPEMNNQSLLNRVSAIKTIRSSMNQMMVATLTASCLVLNVGATTIYTGASGGEFGTPSNWDNGSPGSTDGEASITGGIVNHTVDYTGTNPYTLTLSGASTLNSSAAFTATRLNIEAGSTVNLQTGSAFTLPNTGGGNNAGYAIDGTLEFSGGTHALEGRIGGSGTFRVIGDSASINFHQIGNGGHAYEFEFNSTGVSGIIGAGSSGAGPYFVLAGSTLTVDGSAFIGGGVFTLFDGAQATSFFNTATDVTITGLGEEGTGWDLFQDEGGTSGIVQLTVYQAVPEPSSLALLVIGGALMMGVRRRESARLGRAVPQS